MAQPSTEQLARAVHGQPLRLVLALTGGGSAALANLLSVPGASRSILLATVPYAAEALTEYLGSRPDEFCSPGTARAMAMTAFLKAKQYDPDAAVCGVSCTASLATDRAKRGTHRAHLAYQTAQATAALSVEFEKGRRTRAEEEAIVTALILNHIAEACGISERVNAPLTAREPMQARRLVAPREQQELLAGRTRAIVLNKTSQQKPAALFPGAFHPLHDGHRRMAEVAEQMLGVPVAYEISIENVDKPPLDFLEIEHRTKQFKADMPVWLTRAPQFTQKAVLFPGATFVVGADTIERVGNARYYGGEIAVRDAAIEKIADCGCRFLVFGRTVENAFCTLASSELPPKLLAISQEVPVEKFRHDISSTMLRRQPQTAKTGP